MIELPEALTLAKQIGENLLSKRVNAVLPPSKPHKFCWFTGDPADYGKTLAGSSITGAEGFGMFVEILFDNGQRLCVNDGVNLRLLHEKDAPENYQLLIKFDDGDILAFTVAMYGGITLHNGYCENSYYLKSRMAISPFSAGFEVHFSEVFTGSKPNLSAKAFLATEQRFPGIGNGVTQDILFKAGINPKRKIGSLSSEEKVRLLTSIVSVLRNMTDNGGRDTERDLLGNPGGYRSLMSKNSLDTGCPVCRGNVVKEAYLGGSVYYCPVCQPLAK